MRDVLRIAAISHSGLVALLGGGVACARSFERREKRPKCIGNDAEMMHRLKISFFLKEDAVCSLDPWLRNTTGKFDIGLRLCAAL